MLRKVFSQSFTKIDEVGVKFLKLSGPPYAVRVKIYFSVNLYGPANFVYMRLLPPDG